MSRTDKRDPHAGIGKGSGDIHADECCEGGECTWRPTNTSAQPGGGDRKEGGGYRDKGV